MFINLIYTELIKYKRTIIPWTILIAGSFAAVTALLLVSSRKDQMNWEGFITTSLNLTNLLALLMTAIFTGYVFTCENHENIISVVFTYPVSRLRIFAAKYAAILLFVILFYAVFYFSSIMLGFFSLSDFPGEELLIKFLKVTLIAVAANFVLVPVTALVSITVRGIGTYIFAGMGYFMIYMSFINSDYCLFIPVCIPNKLVENYFVSAFISNEDFIGIFIVALITFLSTFLSGAVLYSKGDVYK